MHLDLQFLLILTASVLWCWCNPVLPPRCQREYDLKMAEADRADSPKDKQRKHCLAIEAAINCTQAHLDQNKVRMQQYVIDEAQAKLDHMKEDLQKACSGCLGMPAATSWALLLPLTFLIAHNNNAF